MRAWKLILLVALVAAMFSLVGARVVGAEAVTFTASTDGKVITLTPSLKTGYALRVYPGQFAGMLVTVNGAEPVIVDWAGVITIGGKPVPPTPDPKPDPKPDPEPLPTPTVLWGIVVEESKERTPAQAVVLLSPKVESAFKATGGKWMVVDAWDDSGKLRDLGTLDLYAKRAVELKIKPVLFIVDPKGTVYSEAALPAKIEDVEALVAKTLKGGK